MSREAHVRFWEGVGVKLPRATHLILFGERRLLRALDEFVAHYHGERNHQGLGNELITPAAAGAGGTQVRCRDRLGGLLRYYHRAA
jgi:putative transposase